METEINQIVSEQPVSIKFSSKVMSILLGLIIIGLICIITLGAFVSMLYKSNNNLQDTLSSNSTELQEFKTEIHALKSRIATAEENDISTAAFINTDSLLDEKKITLQEMQSSIERLDHSNYFANLQHRIEGGVVTDDFVVEHIDFLYLSGFKDGIGRLSATIDLATQPKASSNYKGYGTFDIPDRELKAKINDIINEISERYSGDEIFKGFPKWKDGSYTMTIKNYEIGTYEKGVFKLKGE